MKKMCIRNSTKSNYACLGNIIPRGSASGLFILNQKKFASIFEMKDSNLYKYLIGERKLSPDLVLKLSSFSNTKPELWYYIEIKNELFELNREKGNLKKYEKYNYRNYLSPAMAQA